MDNRENERKDSNQADSELSSTTQFSYKEAKVNVKKIRRLGRIKKTGFAFLAFASFLYLCLYFSLPCFQVENRQVVGLSLFSNQDIASLSNNAGYKPAVFMNVSKSSTTAMENSHGFLLSASFSTNGFSVKGEVVENGPKGRIGNVVYFGKGESEETRKKKLISLPLDSSRIESIKEEIETQSSSVPESGLPASVEDNAQNEKLALDYLSSLPYSILAKINRVNYVSSSDSNWNNLGDFVLKDTKSNRYYVLSSLLMDKLSFYFPNPDFFDRIVNSRKTKSEQREAKEYERKDEQNNKVEAYIFRLVIQGSRVILSPDRKETR